MKKFILTLFLAAGVCWAGTAAELSAAQPAAETEAVVPENEAAIPQTHEDLSRSEEHTSELQSPS